jgi:predicted outer membrane repeat protein
VRLFAGNADHFSPGATTMPKRSLHGALILFLLIALPVRADVRYVDVDAPVSGSGNAWCDAFTDLQDALAIAQAGDEIRIAAGTYTPDQGTGDFLMSFAIPNGVTLRGGYAGCNAGDPDERDPIANPTILSGDLNGDDGPDFSNYEDNSFMVVRTRQAGPATVLDGLIIERGNADGPLNQYDRGGGMYNWLGGPTLRNCTFRLNASTYGGAVCNDASDATLYDCTFEDNQAVIGGGSLYTYNSTTKLEQCRFERNRATNGGGGAVYAINTALDIRQCTWTGNEAASGGALFGASNARGRITCNRFLSNTGTAVSLNNSGHLLFDNCDFESNTGRNAAAVQLSATDGEFVDCTFTANQGTSGGAFAVLTGSLAMRRCVFDSNVSLLGAAGAILLQSQSPALIQECEFVNNLAERGGAMYVFFDTHAAVQRSLFLGNQATQDGGGAIYMPTSDTRLELVGCRFVTNTTVGDGGALNIGRGAELHAVSCAFTGNHADDDGGGAYNDFDSITSYSNCTFTQNTAGFSGDGMYNASSDPDILNSILWNNNGLSTSNQLAGGSPVVDYSCLPGGWGSPNNISADPLFVDPDGPDDVPGTLDDDLRLAAGSPCIDSGSSGLLPADTTDADLDGDLGEPTPHRRGRARAGALRRR